MLFLNSYVFFCFSFLVREAKERLENFRGVFAFFCLEDLQPNLAVLTNSVKPNFFSISFIIIQYPQCRAQRFFFSFFLLDKFHNSALIFKLQRSRINHNTYKSTFGKQGNSMYNFVCMIDVIFFASEVKTSKSSDCYSSS